MKYAKISLLLALMLITACGTNRKGSKSPAVIETSREAEQKKILYPKGTTGEQAGTPASTVNATGITFSGIETEHVRVSGVNPLPVGGVLVLDLDQLEKEFCYPYKGKFISDYGIRNRTMHTGIDIKCIPDDTVRAAFPGVVRMSKNYSGYGNIVVIRHYQGFETVYAHFSRNLVKVNDLVGTGTPIGLAGRTGRATTEHLHFEVRAAGKHIDPKKMLDPDNMALRRGKLYFETMGEELVAYSEPSEKYKMKDEQDRRASELSAANISASAPAAVAQNNTSTPSGQNNTSSGAVPPQNNTGAGSTTGATATNTAPPDAQASQPNTGAQAAEYHTVVKGDTLYALSRKYSTSVKKLCELNGIAENSVLSLGQKIRVK